MRTAIHSNMLFNGEEWISSNEGALVVIKDEKIEYAGVYDHSLLKECKVIDFPNCTIMPGLIDMHVHLSMDGSARSVEQTMEDSIPQATIRAIQNCEKLINNGITSIRDCGCQGNISIEFAKIQKTQSNIKMPRVFACGQVICITGGHGSFIGREVDGIDEVIKTTRLMIKEGVSFIKLISTGGVISKGTKTGAVQLNMDETLAAVNEAQKLGLHTAAHAHGTEGIKIALRAGVNTIEHASYIDDECVELFMTKNAFFTSTLLASYREIEHAAELPEYIGEKIRAHIDREMESVSRLIKVGVPALGGTDAGTPFNPHGDLWEQLLILNKLGLSLENTLRASTSLAAKTVQQEKEIGSLREGMLADVLVVTGNLKKDIKNIARPRAVWLNGLEHKINNVEKDEKNVGSRSKN